MSQKWYSKSSKDVDVTKISLLTLGVRINIGAPIYTQRCTRCAASRDAQAAPDSGTALSSAAASEELSVLTSSVVPAGRAGIMCFWYTSPASLETDACN